MLQEAKDDQQELEILINKLNNDYSPRNETKINERNDVLKFAKKFFLRGKRLLMHLERYFSLHRWISNEKRNR